jgi:hypothetical protein
MNTKQRTGLGHGVLVMALAAAGAIVWSGCSAQGTMCGGYACSEPPEEGWAGGGALPGDDAGTSGSTGGNSAEAGAEWDGSTTNDGSPWNTATDAAIPDASAGDSSVTVASACDYSSQCASGDVCADNQCLPSCAATACPGNYTCSKGACEPNAGALACVSICAGGQCSAACTTNSQCATGDYCDQGACQLDTRPAPDCTQASDCKGTSPQACVNGFCEYTCNTSQQCAEIDVRIDVCSPQGYCASAVEANPQCTQKSDCAAGQDCIGNVCQ